MISLGLGLAGCGAAAAPQPTSTTAAPSDPPTATPTPTVAESPDASDWIIEFGRVGPIALGGSLDEVAPSMSEFTDATQEACPWVVSYEAPGFPAIWLPDGQSTGFVQQIVVQAWADPEAVTADVLRTAEDIGIRSTLAELRAAYPQLIELQGPHNTTIFGITDGEDQWVTFGFGVGDLTEDSTIDTMVVRDTPYQDGEYCG